MINNLINYSINKNCVCRAKPVAKPATLLIRYNVKVLVGEVACQLIAEDIWQVRKVAKGYQSKEGGYFKL